MAKEQTANTTQAAQGFLFAAVGDKYIEEARLSAKSVKKHMPGAQVCLVTDKPVANEAFDHVIEVPVGEGRKAIKLYKVAALQQSPFDKTTFLDTDTFVCTDISELFDMIDQVDLLMAPAPADVSIAQVNGQPQPNFFPYNSGVLVYKKRERTTEFLKKWHELLEKDVDKHPWDQRAMMSAILTCKINTYGLSPIYNLRTDFIVSLPQLPVKIIHGRGVDFEALAARLNAKIANRVWMPKRQEVLYKKQRSLLASLIQKTLQKLGLH